ncbi:MAG: YihY/virulence factor BrkB family protein [Bacteroidota bacterium]
MLKSLKEQRNRLLEKTKKIVLPGFERQNLYDVGKFYREGVKNNAASTRAASVTFRFLLAMFPLVICIFSVIPFVPIENFQSDILISIQEFFPPQVFLFFEEFLKDLIERKQSFLFSIGFLLTIWFASNGVNALLTAFNESYHITVYRKGIKQRLWSLGILAMLFVFGVIVTLVTGFGQIIIDFLYEKQWITGSFAYYSIVVFKSIVSVALFYLVISVLYNVGNPQKKEWKIFSAGATTATICILILKEIFALYLTWFGNFTKLYGQLGAVIALMLFLYYLFLLILVGFELNVSIEKAKYSGQGK